MPDTPLPEDEILALFPADKLRHATAYLFDLQNMRNFVASVMPTGRGATQIVASNDASDLRKVQADQECNGSNDHVQLQAALGALP